jgi:hypothetical protein
VLFRLFDAAKRHPRAPFRFEAAHAALGVGPALHRDVKRQLVAQVVVCAPRPDDGTDSCSKGVNPA